MTQVAMRIDLKQVATQFLRENPTLAEDGETCVFIDEPGYCGRRPGQYTAFSRAAAESRPLVISHTASPSNADGGLG